MKLGCSIEGCAGTHEARGWCKTHYKRWRNHGDPLTLLERLKGTGSFTQKGYVVRTLNLVKKLEHVRIAEQALGHTLPPKAVVHHINEDKADNSAGNLVICPDETYHRLLHQRMRAFSACGHYDWLKCWICKQYDAKDNLHPPSGSAPAYHPECQRIYRRARWAKRKTQ